MKKHKLNVLLVEDSKSDAALVQRMLSDSAPLLYYNFVHVTRLADALDETAQQHFDIALLDLNLLDMEGLASITALHASIPHTPIIVYSGMDDPHLRQQASLCGARYYLVKGRESGYAIKFMIEQSVAS
jgi:CheY-like chemotaxis protein